MTDLKEFDVVVIGAGPGGYVCAITMRPIGHENRTCGEKPPLGGNLS